MKKKKVKRYPTRKTMCATCPFRQGSETAFLAPALAESAANEASRICHSTGANNAFNKRTGKPPMLCRGARDIQLAIFHGMGFIEAATDEAWEKKCKELGL